LLRKIFIAFVSAEFALSAMMSLAGTMIHARFASSIASAQSWNDGEPSDEESIPADKTAPPNIAGTWTGSVQDENSVRATCP
jgi:hypothetical protein